MTNTEQKLINLGCKVWEKYGKRRIYINEWNFKDVFGLTIKRYKTGNLCYCELNGEHVSNSYIRKLLDATPKPYYDLDTQKWHSALKPII